jgi:SMC interacting uncharacterized protein involved in chromosome segregation
LITTPASPNGTDINSARTSIDGPVQSTIDPIAPEHIKTSNVLQPNSEHTSQVPLSTLHIDSIPDLQQTVSLLTADRTNLQNEVKNLQAQLNTNIGSSQLLQEGRTVIAKLEAEKLAARQRIDELEEGLARRTDSERELQARKQEHEGLTRERNLLQREKEQVEISLSDETERIRGEMEELRKGLERAREREGGLEAEVGRLRTVSI